MTKQELHDFDLEIDEIKKTIDLCHPDFDSDILDNLDFRLEKIQEMLEKNIKLVKGAK